MNTTAYLQGYLDKSAGRPRMVIGPESMALFKGMRPGIHFGPQGDGIEPDKHVNTASLKTYPGLGSKDNR